MSQDSFQNAKSFIIEHGRKLDQRLFEYHFENGSRELVIEALTDYQNEDGGFGQALEPDLRTPLSTVSTTVQGLFILRDVGATFDEPLVQKTMRYLLNMYDEENSVWPIVSREALDAPHACHWDDILEKEFDDFFINMRAGLANHLWFYNEIVPKGFAEKITEEAINAFRTISDDQLGWIFNLWSYKGLMNTKGLPEFYHNELFEKLNRVIPQLISDNPKDWTMMSVSPLNMAPSPESPIASIIDPDLIQVNLDHDIETQLPDGTWALDWSWEQDDPINWKIAEKEWKGHLAIGKLKMLRAYGRIH
jgi:hypothetical protein